MLTNWSRQVTTSTGTGNITLASVPGFPTLASQKRVGEVFKYLISSDTGAPLEMGFGSLIDANTMARHAVQSSMINGAHSTTELVNLAPGNKMVTSVVGASSAEIVLPGAYDSHVRGVSDISGYLNSSNLNVTANLAYATIYTNFVDSFVDAFVINVLNFNSQTNDGTIRIAIRDIGLDGLPGTTLHQVSGSITATGIQAIPLPEAIRLVGRFYIVVQFDRAYNIRSSSGNVGSILGVDNSGNIIGAITKPGTATDFPTNWANPSHILGTQSKPLVVLRYTQ